MSSNELKELIKQISSHGKMNFLEPATKKQINTFEKSHEFHLPPTFKKWLLFSDGGEFFLPAGIQIYGVAHKPIINTEDNDRPDESFLVIGALASGDPVLCKSGDEKIYIYDHETETIEDDLVYHDFFALIRDLYDLLGIGE